jgi:hypothetical protein
MISTEVNAAAGVSPISVEAGYSDITDYTANGNQVRNAGFEAPNPIIDAGLLEAHAEASASFEGTIYIGNIFRQIFK